MSAEEKREYNLTITPLWPTKAGNLKSITIKPENFDALQQVKVGGMFLIKENRSKAKHGTSPTHFIEYLTPEKVAEARAAAQSGGYGAQKDTSTADSL